MNFTKISYWLIRSSEDPSKWSAFVKGIGGAIITAMTMINLDTSGMPELVQELSTVAQYLALLMSSMYAMFGAIRKVKTTLLGTNKVLNDRIWE